MSEKWSTKKIILHALLIAAICGVLAGVLFPTVSDRGGWGGKAHVILYCAQDQVYAEPILREFEKENGDLIRVLTIYDSEAVKTVGLANRLLAERSHPQCDVFWGNEELRTRQLAAQNVFRETNGWAAFGHRSRRIVINTNLVSLERRSPTRQDPNGRAGSEIGAPTSLLDLTNAIWRGKVALAYPQFGTTGAHFHALRQLWGEAQWLAWCRGLVANEAKLVDGNSVVVKLVGRGEAAIGLTDFDDILAGQREGLPVASLDVGQTFLSAGSGDFPVASSDSENTDATNTGLELRHSSRAMSPVNRQAGKPALLAETLLIPNTVAVIRNAPHPQNTEKLFQFLQRREVVEKLVAAGALENVTHATNTTDWPALLRDLDVTTKQLNQVFLK